MSETEKKIAKKCLKEEVDKYEEAAQEASQGEVSTPDDASANLEEDDFIGLGLFSNLKPREVAKMKKDSRSDNKPAADSRRIPKMSDC